jgi:chitinase
MKIKISLFLLLCINQLSASDGLCPSPLPKEYQQIKAGHVVSAYFGNWDVYGANHYQIDRIAAIADKLTHLTYGFFKPDDVAGVCKPHDVWADVGAYEGYQSKIGGNFAKMIELKKQFPHLKILLSVGGGTYNKNFANLAKDPEKLIKFAQSCVDRLDFYDHPFLMDDQFKRINHLTYEGLFDGLDLDWEFSPSGVTPEVSQAYTQFVQELRRLLDIRQKNTGQDSLLTIALQVTPTIYNNLDLQAVAKNISWFNVMAYDFYGSSSGQIGFNAPLCGKISKYSVDGAVQRIMQAGVSPDKMVLGLPLYGYVYENTDGYNAYIDKKNKIKTITYHVIKSKYLDNRSYKKTWDHAAGVPSLHSQQDRTFVSYDDQQSLVEKTKLAQAKRMQGVVLWRLSGDDAQHSIVNAIAQTIKK